MTTDSENTRVISYALTTLLLSLKKKNDISVLVITCITEVRTSSLKKKKLRVVVLYPSFRRAMSPICETRTLRSNSRHLRL